MNISELGYELYKIDWIRRISAERQMDVVKNYYIETDKDFIKEYSLDEYILDSGYSGEIYVCYEEFLDAEYLDESYMEYLFDSDELFNEYKKDLEENFYVD